MISHRGLGAPEDRCEFQGGDKRFMEHPWRCLNLWKVRMRPGGKAFPGTATQTFCSSLYNALAPTRGSFTSLLAPTGECSLLKDCLSGCCSVTQSCLILCNTVDCSTSGFPVHHQLSELDKTQVHRVGDAIQPSHPLSSPSPPAFNLSQHQGLFQ